MKTLIVIDMQPFFLNDMDGRMRYPLVKRTAKLVRQAREAGWPIVFIEYHLESYFSTWRGSKKSFREWITTDKDLKKQVSRYRNKYFLKKGGDDGGLVLYNFLRMNNLPLDVVVCGINTDCCVRQTTTTLVKHGTKQSDNLSVTLVSCCMRNNWEWRRQDTRKSIKQWPIYAKKLENMKIESLASVQKIAQSATLCKLEK